MLQTLHNKSSSLFVKIVIGVLVVIFGGFFGVESYMIQQTDTYVAKVGGEEISQQEFRSRYDDYRTRIQQMMGGNVDMQMFDNPTQKRRMLDSMIDEELIRQANENLGLAISPDKIREEIAKVPEFQKDGQFDKEQYKKLLAGRMTPAMYEQRVRESLETRELPAQISASSFVTDAQLDAYLRLKEQIRDFRYLLLEKPQKLEKPIEDSEIEAYYKAHTKDFSTPEKVSLDYLEIDGNQLKTEVQPDETTLKARYEEQKEKGRFVTKEQRLASHILIKVDKNADAATQKQSLEKAQEIAKEAKSAKDFAEVAKQKSDDLGSKAQGGDLDWLEKGVVEPEFEKALFDMQKGDISDPILSAQGYHIIQLRDIRPGKTQTFEEIKEELTKEYLDGERERTYSDKAGKLTDLIYQDPSSLEPAAKALNLTIQKTELVSRDGLGATGMAANPNVLKAAFSESVLVEGHTSDPIEIAPNHVVVIRVNQHEVSKPKALEEVKEEVRTRITTEKLAAEAKKQAETLAERLKKGEKLDQLATELKLKVNDAKSTGRQAANLDAKLVAKVFEMSRPESADKPRTSLASLGSDNYALVELTAVTDGDPTKVDTAARDTARNQLLQGISAAASKGFIDTLRKEVDIKIAESRM